MALYIPAGYAQCTLSIAREGDPEPYNVTWGSVVSDPYGPLLASYKTIFNGLAQALGGNERMTTLTIRQGPSTDPDAPSAEFPLNIDGTDLVPRTPPNVAVLLRKVTGLGGRKNRGRMYWPSVAESTIDDTGTLLGSTITAFNDIWETWKDLWETTEGLGQQVILHQSETAPTPITGYACQNLAATQRRRLRR